MRLRGSRGPRVKLPRDTATQSRLRKHGPGRRGRGSANEDRSLPADPRAHGRDLLPEDTR